VWKVYIKHVLGDFVLFEKRSLNNKLEMFGDFSRLAFYSIALMALWKLIKFAIYKPKNFPPGPPRIPIFGSYPG
jgi:hypothetical protein